MGRRLKLAFGFITVLGWAGCGGRSEPAESVVPASPLPTAGLAGQKVTVYPITLVTAARDLEWQDELGSRLQTLRRVDSVIAVALTERSPEVEWVLPDALRRAAERAPGLLTSPDRMSTAFLRHRGTSKIPDPLRSQMRSLTGVAGGRYALIPASLFYSRAPDGNGQAEITLVLADVRMGTIGWRTVARGEAEGPWVALWEALKTLTPGLP